MTDWGPAVREYESDAVITTDTVWRNLADAAIAELKAEVERKAAALAEANELLDRMGDREDAALDEAYELREGLLHTEAEVERLTWMLHEAWEGSEEWQWNESEETWLADLARRWEERDDS